MTQNTYITLNTKLFNAAQPGVGRVHVLGSKKVVRRVVGFHESLDLKATRAFDRVE